MLLHSMSDGAHQIIEGEYSPFFVVLSIVFSCVSSFTALSLNERAKDKSFINRKFWISLAAVALAFGIWSLHYMGMLAYMLPIKIEYNTFYTVISMVPILIASFIALFMINLRKVTIGNAFISSVFISIGIGSMHILGMESMEINGDHMFDIRLVSLSLLVPFVTFVFLIRFFSYLKNWRIQLLFGILIGLSIAATHYLCMHAMTLYIDDDVVISDVMYSIEHVNEMAIALTLFLTVIVGMLLLSIFIDFNITKRVEKFDTVTHLENSHQLVIDFQKYNFKKLALWVFNDFDHINKTFGYYCGDQYIIQMVDRIQNELERSHKIYRFGQNQILLAATDHVDPFTALQYKISKKIAVPVFIEGNEKSIHPQVICALSNDVYSNNDELLKQVTSISRIPNLTYDASVVTYNEKKHSLNVHDAIVENIEQALLHNELFLVYQPKICTADCSIVGVEALIRWHHKEYGFISPGVFVPILESNGKMGIVTNWVIKQVCMQLQLWKKQNVHVGSVAINIPGDYLISNELVECLQLNTAQYGILPSEIDLELTETSFVQNLELAMRAVEYFKKQGYDVALDDFGTGLSSLSYLRQMQITTLKVDKSFIDHVPHYEKDVAIAKTIIALGEALNLQIVVEGIETKEQLEFVMEACESPIVQGYYFAKPLHVPELEQMIAKMQVPV